VETYHYSTTIHVPQVLIATFQKVHSLRTGGVTMETYYYGHQSILMMMMTMMTTTHTDAVANAIYLPQRAMSHLSSTVLSIYLSIYLTDRAMSHLSSLQDQWTLFRPVHRQVPAVLAVQYLPRY